MQIVKQKFVPQRESARKAQEKRERKEMRKEMRKDPILLDKVLFY